MTIFKMNALATALAFAGLLASSVATEASYSDCSSTLPLVTQEAGATTSDGTIFSTWSICTVVHQTSCDVSTATVEQALPTGPTGGASVPGESAPTSYKEGEHVSSTYHGEAEPSQSAPGQSVPAGGSQPPYSSSAQSIDTSVNSGQPSVSNVVPTAVIDTSGKPSSAYPEPTDEEAGPSHSHTGINPSASDNEVSASAPPGASGTPPTTTATSAASMHDSVSAVMLAFAGAVGVVGVTIF